MHQLQQALDSLFPFSWLDPYGLMPLNRQTGLTQEHATQVDITQVQTDDGIRVTAVKTPPQSETNSLQGAIQMALGMGCLGNCVEEKPEEPQKREEPKADMVNRDAPEREGSDDSAEDGEKQPKTGHSSPSSKFAGLKSA